MYDTTYVAAYRLEASPSTETMSSFVAVAVGQPFHDGLFAEGPTADEAVRSLAVVIREALLSKASRWPTGRFDQVLLIPAAAALFRFEDLPAR
jgi:hypothetical protein